MPSVEVVCCIFLLTLFDVCKYVDKQCGPRLEQSDLGPRCLSWVFVTAVGSESECRSMGRKFDPSPVPYFCGD